MNASGASGKIGIGTQQHVADLLSVNRRTHAAYENGVNNMSPETPIKLAKLYQTSVDYLLGLTNNPKPYRTLMYPWRVSSPYLYIKVQTAVP